MDKFFIGEEYLALENKRVATLKYFLLEEAKIVEETGEMKNSYGIKVEKWIGKDLEEDIVSNVTTEKENAKSITLCLKENKVTPVHLKDIIVDML